MPLFSLAQRGLALAEQVSHADNRGRRPAECSQSLADWPLHDASPHAYRVEYRPAALITMVAFPAR